MRKNFLGENMIFDFLHDTQSDTGLFIKECIFPIASSFFSAFLGVMAAKLTFRHQEKVRVEINKVTALNKLIITMGEARGTLLGIVYNYNELKESHFISRTLAIPPIIVGDYKVDKSLHEISFMVNDDEKGLNLEYNQSWKNILRVGAMIDNYHHIFSLLIKRNELIIDFNNKSHAYRRKKGLDDEASMSLEMFMDFYGKRDLIALCDLTERLISFIDDILFEINDFMFNLPKEAKSKVNIKLIKNYCTILQYKENRFDIKRTLEPDYKIIAEFLEISLSEAKARYDNGYKRS